MVTIECRECGNEEEIGPFTFYFLLSQLGYSPDEIEEISEI
jgi:hypothetical protein